MNALHFGRFYNDNFGGLERHVALLLRGLSREMHVDNLVASDDFSAQILQVAGYRVYKVPMLGMVSGAALCPTMPLWARRLHRENHYDIAHLHFPDPMSHLVALTLPKEIKIVISWHSDIVRPKNFAETLPPVPRSHRVPCRCNYCRHTPSLFFINTVGAVRMPSDSMLCPMESIFPHLMLLLPLLPAINCANATLGDELSSP